jgi:predicted transcriptional regulator
MKLQSPTGKDIVGTDERIPGTAQIINSGIEAQQSVDGQYDIDYEGTTDVGWDGQETRTACGQRIFVDSDGGLWLERELVLVAETEEEVEAIKELPPGKVRLLIADDTEETQQ